MDATVTPAREATSAVVSWLVFRLVRHLNKEVHDVVASVVEAGAISGCGVESSRPPYLKVGHLVASDGVARSASGRDNPKAPADSDCLCLVHIDSMRLQDQGVNPNTTFV